jgi:hypothetical protein
MFAFFFDRLRFGCFVWGFVRSPPPVPNPAWAGEGDGIMPTESHAAMKRDKT